MTDSQKQAQEEIEIKALDLLTLYLMDMYHARNRKRKLRRHLTDERPWRASLGLMQGLAQFGVFLQKLEGKEKAHGTAGNYLYR